MRMAHVLNDTSCQCHCIAFDSTTHTHHTENHWYFFLYYLLRLKKTAQAKSLFSNSVMATKIPKRDLGPFMRVVRNALLGVSIWREKWANEWIVLWVQWDYFDSEICCSQLHNLWLWMWHFKHFAFCSLCASYFRNWFENTSIFHFNFLSSFQRDHNFAIRFDQDISAHDQPPPNVPEGPAHKYVQCSIAAFICLGYCFIRTTLWFRLWNEGCQMKNLNWKLLSWWHCNEMCVSGPLSSSFID